MAEAIGIPSSFLTRTEAALQSSITLYETMRNFHSRPQYARDLSDELDALHGVLKSILANTAALPDVDFSALEFPLAHYCNACQEFSNELKKHSSKSTSDQTSFCDWAKLRYMGDDVDVFRRLLSSYKLTISMTLTDASLRKTSATAEHVQNLFVILDKTSTSLVDQLKRLNDKLNRMVDIIAGIQIDAREVDFVKEERNSIEKCLQICARLAERITQTQLVTANLSTGIAQACSSQQVTNVEHKNPRRQPCHLLRNSGIPSVVWFEDALKEHGVPTAVFELHLLVPNIKVAAHALERNGWTPIPQQLSRIGLAILDLGLYPQQCVTILRTAGPARHQTKLEAKLYNNS